MRSGICTEALAVLVAFSLFTSSVRAQEADACATLRSEVPAPAPEPTRVERDGVPGMWFPMPIARLMLCEVRELRLQRRAVGLDARELRLWEERLEIQQDRVRLATDVRRELESVLEAAERRARVAEEARDDWTRSPVLWFAVGVVAAVLIAGGGALLLAEIR